MPLAKNPVSLAPLSDWTWSVHRLSPTPKVCPVAIPAALAGAVVAARSSAVDAAHTPARVQVFVLINPPCRVSALYDQT
ncbi:hypothetical protein [Phytohabitans rumicis]|uniref:hypothetical protein n=1 Tax=Phytohabitans rumicis TaxID=1076125 RepID=UPI001563B8AB|nr:hypothetical protein [Phytohabitans rumicis]